MIFKVLGYICDVLGLLDFASTKYFDTCVTGVGWSPLVAFALGTLLHTIGSMREEESEEVEDA